MDNQCESCGLELRVGDWPYCPHGSATYRVDLFAEPEFNYCLGEYVTSYHDGDKKAQAKGMVARADPADTPRAKRDLRDRQMAKAEAAAKREVRS